MPSPSATCSQHALREATGICVRCRAPMCGECITKIDGINHCRRCLELMVSSDAAAATPEAAARMPTWLALGVGSSLLTGLTWWMLEVLMPGSRP